MSSRTTERARGGGALAVLLAATFGVPWALTSLGQGAPVSLPSGHAVANWASNPITDEALLRMVAVLCWAVWALFVTAVAVEVVVQTGQRSRRPGRPVGATRRQLRIPGLQSMAATCVLTALLLLPLRPPRADLAGRVHSAAAVRLAAPDSEPAAVVRRPDTDDPTPQGWHRYVVQRYDSPWSIAERHLGHGSKWRELRDAEGRPLWEPDHDKGPEPEGWSRGGRSGYHGRARIINPGDVLLIPGPPAATSKPHVPSADLDSPVGRREDPVPPAPPAAPADPGPRSATALGPLPPGASDLAGPVPSPPIMAAIDHGSSGWGASGRGASDLPLVFVEGGLLSASLFGMVELLRRRQRQHRQQGRRVRLPAGDLMNAEVGLRIGQRPDLAARVSLATSTLIGNGPLPAIVGVVADEQSIEVMLAEPAPARPPWHPAAEGFRWRLRDDDVDSAAALCSEPLPALAPVGKAAGSGADVLINLETAGLLGVKGDLARAAEIVYAMAASLCGLPWTAALNLLLVGFGQELAAAPQARTVASLGSVLPELRSTARVTGELLTAHHCRSTWEGRTLGLAGDGWPPTVVLCCAPLANTEMAELEALVAPGQGVAAVFPTDANLATGWTIDADRIPMVISPLRLAVQPTALSAASLDAVARLLAVADDVDGATLHDPPYDRIQLSAELPAADLDPPAPAVLVRVLGTIEIEGAAEFRRAKSRELAVYLALHPHGVGEAELDEALWPSDGGRLVPPSTRDSTVSAARTALGGPERLLPAQGQGREKRYQVSGEVESDFGLFCRLHRHARSTGSLEALTRALGLVRGRPFEGVLSGRTYTWIHTEGHARHIESEVGDAADLAAQLFLERGQAVEARRSARQGLAADPLCERLWVRLMEAADQLGESQEVERLMDELDIVLELGGDFSGLHPNTLAAYARYRRGSQRSRSTCGEDKR